MLVYRGQRQRHQSCMLLRFLCIYLKVQAIEKEGKTENNLPPLLVHSQITAKARAEAH